jgi:membrane-bound lytic murein transglycosylase B
VTDSASTYRLSRRRFIGAVASAPLAWHALHAYSADGYAGRPEVRAFVQEMSIKHGLDSDTLLQLFRHAQYQPAVIRAIMPPRNPRVRSWRAYRPRYVNEDRISNGVRFWRAHASVFEAAEQRYHVPQEIMAAIIGVETIYGRITGGFQTLSALSTLAFDYPARAKLFRQELEELLLLAQEKGRSAITFKGSYAGAIGLPQFLPSSYRRFAVDFDGDGKVELLESPADAIASVGNYLQEHGWRKEGRIAIPAIVPPEAISLADGDVLPKYSVEELSERGISTSAPTSGDEKCALIDLVTPDQATEYWLGFENFYVLTRYNRSSFYAMAVFHLAKALRDARPELIARR